MRTRSQRHAETIHGMVSEIGESCDRRAQKRYGSLCHDFPLVVRENGLAAALGFLAAKGGSDAHSPENRLLTQLAQILGASDSERLRQTVIEADLVV